jgi:acetophenone carboxylase
MSAGIPWRRRLSELGRGAGKPHPPLFAPLLYGVASQIEALPATEMTVDPTRLGKCLTELRRVLGTSPLMVAAPSGMEAEALGATVDRESWPPRRVGCAAAGIMEITDFAAQWAQSEALAASLETCKRLSTTLTDDPVILAALSGPASLLESLWDASSPPPGDLWEFAGRALAALAREFAQRGVSGFLLCEPRPPQDEAGWRAALNTIGNIARFHRIPALLLLEEGEPGEWPNSVVACPSLAGESQVVRPHGLVVSADPARWSALAGHMGSARVVFSARDVDAEYSIEALREACEAALEMEQEPSPGALGESV